MQPPPSPPETNPTGSNVTIGPNCVLNKFQFGIATKNIYCFPWLQSMSMRMSMSMWTFVLEEERKENGFTSGAWLKKWRPQQWRRGGGRQNSSIFIFQNLVSKHKDKICTTVETHTPHPKISTNWCYLHFMLALAWDGMDQVLVEGPALLWYVIIIIPSNPSNSNSFSSYVVRL